MAKIFTTEYELTALADAIRERGGTSESLAFPSGYVQAINNIERQCVNPNLFERTMTRMIDRCSISDLTRIPKNLFRECIYLADISFPMCREIGSSAFEFARSLQEIVFPECEILEDDAFYGCDVLHTASLPKCEIIGSEAFAFCSSLANVYVPRCTTVWSWGFSMCIGLPTISLPVCSYIGTLAFAGCSSLKSVYLMSTSPVTLGASTTFRSTPIADSPDGLIYVPGSLIETYKTFGSWSYYSSKFVAGD